MKVLALDTATECCSAALWLDGEVTALERFSAREHASLILPMIDELLTGAGLRLAGLDALAFGRGPGGFTGVRIATGVAQGLAFGADLPLVPVSDLAALAAGARRRHGVSSVLAVMDARMGETYWSAVSFDAHGAPTLLLPERVSPPHAVVLPPCASSGDAARAWWGAGPGWSAYPDALAAVAARMAGVDGDCFPHARDVAALAAIALAAGDATVAAEAASPVYLRDRVATPSRRGGR